MLVGINKLSIKQLGTGASTAFW